MKDIRTETLEFPAGYFGLVTMTTQAGYAIEVTITDQNGTQLFYAQRSSGNPIPTITGTFITLTDNPTVTIRCDDSTDLDVRYEQLTISNNDDSLITRDYVFVAEYWTDYDYNDLFLSVSAWQHNG